MNLIYSGKQELPGHLPEGTHYIVKRSGFQWADGKWIPSTKNTQSHPFITDKQEFADWEYSLLGHTERELIVVG